jgi:hypothetical protein
VSCGSTHILKPMDLTTLRSIILASADSMQEYTVEVSCVYSVAVVRLW